LIPAYQPAVLTKIVQSDGSRFVPKAMPKGFNQTRSFASPKKGTGGRKH
jgi:hypothetical protein